jgi:hypothetical protein
MNDEHEKIWRKSTAGCLKVFDICLETIRQTTKNNRTANNPVEIRTEYSVMLMLSLERHRYVNQSAGYYATSRVSYVSVELMKFYETSSLDKFNNTDMICNSERQSFSHNFVVCVCLCV